MRCHFVFAGVAGASELGASLKSQNFWWESGRVPKELVGVKRETSLIEFLGVRELKVITGVRRSGKSTLIYQLIDYLLKNNVEPKQILLINFDFDKFEGVSLEKVFENYLELTNADPKKVFLFLDEVHHRPGWVSWVRKLYDLRKVKQIFATDSSSKIVVKEYSNLLTGRNIKLEVFPLSFKEYLGFSGCDLNNLRDLKLVSSETEAKIKHLLNNYLLYGGFPEIFFKSSVFKQRLLKNYFDDIINKDISERYQVDAGKVKTLAHYLLTNISKRVSLRSVRNGFGFGLETISGYLRYLEEAFLVFSVKPFFYSVKKQVKELKKIYCVDVGLRNAVCFRFAEDFGRLYENVVAIELKRRGKEFFYWRNYGGDEVDFVVKDGLKPKQFIQVCFDVEDERVKKRELIALVKAVKELRAWGGGGRFGGCFVVTKGFEGSERINGVSVSFIPLWKWLLTGC